MRNISVRVLLTSSTLHLVVVDAHYKFLMFSVIRWFKLGQGSFYSQNLIFVVSDLLLVLAGSSLLRLDMVLKLSRHFPQIFHFIVYFIKVVVVLFKFLNCVILVAHEEVNDSFESFPTEHGVELLTHIDRTLQVWELHVAFYHSLLFLN